MTNLTKSKKYQLKSGSEDTEIHVINFLKNFAVKYVEAVGVHKDNHLISIY